VNTRRFRTAYIELTQPLLLVSGLLIFVSTSIIRSNWFFVTVVILVVVAMSVANTLQFELRHGDAFRDMLRHQGLDPWALFPLGLALSWLLAALYLLGAFAFTYWALNIRDAQAFSEPLTQLDAFYFATTTFTTTGYGDIAPMSQAARIATSIQMAIGFGLVAIVLAVALSQRERKHEK
jgi:hypothetical protein